MICLPPLAAQSEDQLPLLTLRHAAHRCQAYRFVLAMGFGQHNSFSLCLCIKAIEDAQCMSRQLVRVHGVNIACNMQGIKLLMAAIPLPLQHTDIREEESQ